MEKRKKRRSKALIRIGALLILAAASLTLYNVLDAYRAGRTVQNIEDELTAVIDQNKKKAEDTVTESSVREMDVVTLDGVAYIGTISIPAAGLVLPVQYNYSFDGMRNSPCRYYGSYMTNDLVICAHDFSKHFGPIRWLEPGDDVYLQTVDDVQIRYTVVGLEKLQPDEVDRMVSREDETLGSWDLTLFTCYFGGQTRCAVRCARTEA